MPDSTGNDIRVETWDQLHSVLYDIERNLHGRRRSNFVYRCVGDKAWDLKTSLQRLGKHYPSVENPLLRNFLKYARPGEIASNALLFRLAVAQHYGLPTRVLDWTTSPKVALHFATCEQKHFDKDAAIWCVDVAEVRALLPDELRKELDDENAFVFSVEMLPDCKTLRDFDKWGKDFVLFFEPPSLDDRIVNQAAILSIMPGSCLELQDFLKTTGKNLFKRIIIPQHIKWEVRDKLDQDNVTERMLFPGMAGTSDWLRRYYGPGPSGHVASVGDVPSNCDEGEPKI